MLALGLRAVVVNKTQRNSETISSWFVFLVIFFLPVTRKLLHAAILEGSRVVV